MKGQGASSSTAGGAILARLGYLASLMFTGTLVGMGLYVWAVTEPFTEAIELEGVIVAGEPPEPLRSEVSGVLREVHVKASSRVTSGSLIVRIETGGEGTSPAEIAGEIDAHLIRKARLVAERDRRETFDLPAILEARADDPAVLRHLESERRVLAERHRTREKSETAVKERLAALTEQVSGLAGRISAGSIDVGRISEEIASASAGVSMGARILELLQDAQRKRMELAAFRVAAAEAQERIRQADTELKQISEAADRAAMQELERVEAALLDAERRRETGAQPQLVDVTSPFDGVITELKLPAVGAEVRASDALALIARESRDLRVECPLQPGDVVRVRKGQMARVRFEGVEHSVVPHIAASLSLHRRPDVQGADGGEEAPLARLDVSQGEARLLGGVLMPGTKAEVRLPIEERSIGALIRRMFL